MPFSEPMKMGEGKVDTTHQKLTYLSTDHSIFISNPQDGKDSVLNDFPLCAPPWLKCPILDDPFNTEYPFDECLHELDFPAKDLTIEASASMQRHKTTPRAGNLEMTHFDTHFKCPTEGLADSEELCLIKDSKINAIQKNPEPAVAAASSVCSASSLERASNEVLASDQLKRKSHETEDEGESLGVRKTTPNHTGSKRSRARQLHDLCERRRRDGIDEKMRQLQKLIPNCNQVDKVSLLDEAIEYLKTLQLQLQILSMGNWMYMSSMMLQATMQQRAQRAYLPQLLPMQNVQVPVHPVSTPICHGLVARQLLMSVPCAQLPIFPPIVNNLMNE